MDISDTILPKSDQLNADSLLAGAITITISSVNKNTGEQPVAINYQGGDGKPYLPCKQMRRVMVQLWGKDASQYVGRSMTLYRDAKVTWAGAEVGGIRISHMSHIEGKQTMSLTASNKAKKPYIVLPLGDVAPPKKTIDAEPLKLGAEAALLRGSESLKTWFMSLSNDERIVIKPLMEDYKARAIVNDKPVTTENDEEIIDE